MVYMALHISPSGITCFRKDKNDLPYTVTIPEIPQNVNSQWADIYNFGTFNKFIDF